MVKSIFVDWKANQGNVKGRLVLVLFRIANAASRLHRPYVYFAYPYLVFYRVVVEWLLGIELPWRLCVGAGLRMFHGQALVVNDRSTIGRECVLRHSTTIGVSHTSQSFEGNAPTIGDYVDVGAHVIILGGISIGSGAAIAAGSVVVHDVPMNAVVAGNPARVIRIRQGTWIP